MLVGHPFIFPFCQRHWDLKKRRDDIAVADMVADMEVHMLADKKKEEKKWPTWS